VTDLGSLLDELPTGDAVHLAAGSVTRDELVAGADALAAALASAGVGPGEVVGVMLPNGAGLVAALFGVWRGGAVYAPLNPRASDADLAAAARELQPAALVTSGEHATRIEGDFAVVVPTGRGWEVQRETTGRGDRPSHDGVALVQFTSGTTGPPKAVPLRHDAVLDLLDRVVGTLRGGRGSGRPASDRPPMPNLVPVSLSLWAGIYQVLFAFRVGAPIVLMERFDTREFARLVRTFEIRSTVLPPAAMSMLADDDGVEDLAPLRMVRSITAPLSPAQARRFRDRFGVVVLNSYGQTELGGEVVGWSAADAREHGEAKLGAVGRPHAGVEVRVSDDGELLVRTAATTGDRVASEVADRLAPDGWFRTGDLGRVDDDGFVWIDGRVTDMINRGGLKVIPAQVEEVLVAAPAVRDAAVVGVPDDRLGEVPCAFVVLTGGALDAGALEEWCRARLSAYKVPVRFVAVDALPRNEIGKVLKRELAARDY
jgi:acyl-CoA synthetase (AMP-forming)/AMP-acid ligase II